MPKLQLLQQDRLRRVLLQERVADGGARVGALEELVLGVRLLLFCLPNNDTSGFSQRPEISES